MPTLREVYSIEFEGRAGDERDVLAQRLIRESDGVVMGAGTFLANPPIRDIQFSVPTEKAAALVEQLRAQGFTLKAESH